MWIIGQFGAVGMDNAIPPMLAQTAGLRLPSVGVGTYRLRVISLSKATFSVATLEAWGGSVPEGAEPP